VTRRDDNEEQYLDFLRYQEVGLERVTKRSDRQPSAKDKKWMSSRDAKKHLRAQAREDKKRGNR
jgi:hypothetical protein